MSLFVSSSVGTMRATFPPTLSLPAAPRHLRHGGLAPHGLALTLAAMLVGGIVALAAAVAVAAEAPMGPAPGTPAAASASAGSAPAAAVTASGPRVVVRRFALIAGVSQGGPDRVPLRYAGTDAKAVQRVLADLGGVSQSTLLLDSGRAELRRAFDKLDQQIAAARAPGQRTEMIFYYSGHSDENGLLLGPDRVTYAELRAWVEQTKADVRIAVLDSCASGALTRIKGGVHQAPFLVDTSSAARGHAYLTASSENEVAQESDRIGAAYFTHYLVSGLRGAADVSQDGRVTLSEAYQYAFTETLARTETSKGGPQHASYDFQLSGKGDLVMTDLHATSARLVLPPEMAGRLFVRDAQGRLIAEVHKLPAQPIELGLPPGPYRVVLDDDRRLSEARIELVAGKPTALSTGQLVALAPTASVRRGPGGAGDGDGADTEASAAAALASAPVQPVNISIYPGLDTNGGVPSHNKFVLGFVARSASLNGLALTLGDMIDGDARGADLSAIGSLVRGNFRGAHLSGMAALALGDVRGAQLGGWVSWAGKNMTGVQLAGLVAGAGGAAKGLQIGGLASWAGGSLGGLQIAGGVSAARGGYGLQIGGLGAASLGDFRGLQLGTAAYASGDVRGAQISGSANVARSIEGFQLSVVNVGGDVTGAQIGVVNVARHVRGTQFGVVNVAETMSGASLGLVTFVRDGIHELEVAASETGASTFSGLLGSRHIYTRLGVGWMPAASDIPGARTPTTTLDETGSHWLFQWGVGGRLQLHPRWTADLEVVGTQFNFVDENKNVLGSARALFNFRVAPQFAVMFGPTFTTAVGWDGSDPVTSTGVAERVIHDGQTTVRMYPGFVAGLRI